MTSTLRRTAPVALAALLCLSVAGCGSNGSDGVASDGQTRSGASPSPSTGSTSATAPGPVSPVYFVMSTPTGDRLAAENHPVTHGSAADNMAAALTALEGKPTDPDYRTTVAPKSLSAPAVKGNEITVEVDPRFAKEMVGASPQDAKLTVQQVVYTLNAAAGTAKKPLPVHFMSKGKDSTYLGQKAVAKPGNQLATLALMNVLEPADGSTLTAGRTTFSGVGSSNEATVAWEVDDSSGKKVLSGSTMAAGWMNRLYPWKASVDLSKLSAGRYTFVASTDDQGEGPGPTKDTKTFTIR